MKKLLLILSLVLTLGLYACGGDEDSDKGDLNVDNPSASEYIVTFYDANNSVLKEQSVGEGDNATAPADPTKEGYTFNGWAISFSDVQSNIDVYPTWIEEFTVNLYQFSIYVDGEIEDVLTVGEGANFPIPTKVDDETKTFDGWYLDAEYTMPLNIPNMPASNFSVYGRWIPVVTSTIRTDEVGTSWYLGNSNGNLHNNGYAVYDNDLDIHYYVANNGIYSFDPSTMTNNLLFQSTGGPKSLMINGTQLFFIDSSNRYLYMLDLTTHQVTNVLEMEILRVARYSGYIYVQYMSESFGNTYLNTHILDDETLELRTLKTSGAENLNMLSSRLFYTSGTNVRLMATGLNGKTTLEDLSGYTLEEVHQLLVVDYDYDAHEFAMIASSGAGKGFYVFRDGVLSNIMNGDIVSINHNGSIYSILVDGMVKTYNADTGELSDLVSVGGMIDSINTVNYWYYFVDEDSGTMYQYDPKTENLNLIQ